MPWSTTAFHLNSSGIRRTVRTFCRSSFKVDHQVRVVDLAVTDPYFP